VSSATAAFAMMFSASISVVEFYLLKRFPVPYGKIFSQNFLFLFNSNITQMSSNKFKFFDFTQLSTSSSWLPFLPWLGSM
jgi:hypothetical protein